MRLVEGSSMTALLPCTCSNNCQVEANCYQPPRFQARLAAARPAQHAPVCRRTEACASHLVAMVDAMTSWAREQELTEGDLTILTIDPPPGGHRFGRHSHPGCTRTNGLVFSVIHLGT
jgi:hypothetical protein